MQLHNVYFILIYYILILKYIFMNGWVGEKYILEITTLNIVYRVTNANCLGQH